MARALVAIAVAVAAALAAAPVVRADDKPGAGASIDARIARGKELFDEQEYAAAIQLLTPITRDARATRSQRLAALEQIALAHFIRRDLGAARAIFERILDIDPGYAEAWNNLGIVRGELGDRAGAIAALHRALELVPHYADAHYNLARLYERTGEKVAALRHLKSAHRLARK